MLLKAVLAGRDPVPQLEQPRLTPTGIAVTGTMIVTALMAFVVIRKVWRWPMLGRHRR